MDITVQREALLKPLQAISGIVEKKQTLPILSNILLATNNPLAAKNQLCITGTNLEVELVGFSAIETIEAEGATTVSARKLFDICRALPDGTVLRLALETNHLVVRAGESCFKLNTLSPQDFPNLEESECPVQFNIKQSDLKSLLTKTYFSMGQQDVRHYLNATFLEISHHSIKCIAADGHRLALAAIKDENISKVEAKIILPRKSVLELIRLLGNDDNHELTINLSDTQFRISTPDFIFTSKLINAQYPDYTRLIPKGQIVALGDREAIKQALVRTAILSNDKFHGVRFQLEPNKLRMTANNSDQEHAEEVVMLDYPGKEMEIGFNIAYLLDAVSAIAAKSIRCIFTNPNEGVIIESADNEDSLYVIMPMRI